MKVVIVQSTLEVMTARPERVQKPRRKQLSDLENAAVQDELRRLKEELGSLRRVGTKLGYPEKSAQATISAALKGRAGRELAAALYRHLRLSREDFLARKGLGPVHSIAPEVVRDEAAWTALGLPDDVSRRLAETVRAELDALGAARKRPSKRP